MTQALSSQAVPVAAMDTYRWQHSLEQSHSSTKCSRNRGMILSYQGWQKLMQAGVLYDKFGSRCTYEWLSERSLLDERTVSRLLSCEIKVDKRTLKTFFRAFNLSLEADDYFSFQSDRKHEATLDPSTCAGSIRQRVEFEHLVKELSQLQQRVEEYDRLFQHLGLDESYIDQQLRA